MRNKDIDMEHHGEIMLYQPDEAVKLEVRLEDETVWLTQAQIAELFGTEVLAISKHIRNIIRSGEFREGSNCFQNGNSSFRRFSKG